MAIEAVQSTDTPNQGRVKWNANDAELNTNIGAVSAALNTHKTSSDHDSRYYTKSVVDSKDAAVQADVDALEAAAVKVTGNQTIAGEKTLTDDLRVKKATPIIKVYGATETLRARIIGSESGADASIALQLDGSTNVGAEEWANVLVAGKKDGILSVPARDVYAKGEKLASEKYVQERVKTGNFVLVISRRISSLVAGTYHFLQPDGERAYLIPPAPSRLLRVTSTYAEDFPSQSAWGVVEGSANYSFVPDLAAKRIIRGQLVAYDPAGAADLALKLELYAVGIDNAEVLIHSEVLAEWQGAPGSVYVSTSLLLSI
jgi:hypothetical protein